MAKTNGEKWRERYQARLEGYCKARGFTLPSGAVDVGWAYYTAIRDYTGHRVELYGALHGGGYDGKGGWLAWTGDGEEQPLTGAGFDALTGVLVRRALVSKRQLALPL